MQGISTNIERNFNHMSRMVDNLNCQLENVKRERCILSDLAAPEKCLQEHNELLTDECCQKEREIQNLQDKLVKLEGTIEANLLKEKDLKVKLNG